MYAIGGGGSGDRVLDKGLVLIVGEYIGEKGVSRRKKSVKRALHHLGDGLSVDLKLTQTPAVCFYQSLHNLLKE